jgi:hypothetical protein
MHGCQNMPHPKVQYYTAVLLLSTPFSSAQDDLKNQPCINLQPSGSNETQSLLWNPLNSQNRWR